MTWLINNNWFFKPGFHWCTDKSELVSYEAVVLPHSAVQVPLNYFDETVLHQDFTYHREIYADEAMMGSDVVIHFAGVLSDAKVYLNGKKVAEHSDGYTGFDAVLTPHLTLGDNIITVHVSGREQGHIPPFGGRIDFLCFPGIYRDVTLSSYSDTRVLNAKIETHNVLADPSVSIDIKFDKALPRPRNLLIDVTDTEGVVISTMSTTLNGTVSSITCQLKGLSGIKLWDLNSPTLYWLNCYFEDRPESCLFRSRFGFREAQFTTNGFYLNGNRVQLVGVNRHQSYPYVGYAMGARAQALDAELIKEWGFNMVRTSHYPQSPDFLARCDELGLLVFEELTGWQHIGDEEWQQRALENVASMITRDWNHPSIVIWGVRINESVDNHAFYTKTNALAHRLDSSRQTGGVRCIEQSELLEDVYTMNDFILGDGDTIIRDPFNVTGLEREVPYLITEYAGHMFPTKRQDCENWQMEHVLRHLKVLDASFSNPNISGAITWCMFDYNTHRDFGSGDKICYHGLSDAFRIPKFAKDVYASQQSHHQQIVLTPVTYWTRGERPEANPLPLIILTNCDYLVVSMPTGESKRFYPDRAKFAHLPHPPIVIDQLNIGDFPLGDWGYSWMDLHIEGYVAEQCIRQIDLAANPIPTTLNVSIQSDTLIADCEDSVRVVITALDQNGQIMPYFQDVISIEVGENLSIIGPQNLPLNAGACALWIKAGQEGESEITLSSQRFGCQRYDISVVKTSSNPERELQHG